MDPMVIHCKGCSETWTAEREVDVMPSMTAHAWSGEARCSLTEMVVVDQPVVFA